jgi:hypothetical protein
MKGVSVNHKDMAAGLLFMTFGALGLAVGSGYEIGTALRMGPGYFPVVISTLLLLIGAVVSGRALWTGPAEIEWGSPRPVVLVLAAVLAFALLIEPAGLALATLILLGLVYIGGWRFRPLEFAAIYLSLVVGAFLLFVQFLQLPLIMFPGS